MFRDLTLHLLLMIFNSHGAYRNINSLQNKSRVFKLLLLCNGNTYFYSDIHCS